MTSARQTPAGSQQPPSARREQLLELAYEFVKEHGLADMSLRPLASAIGSSPRVLLFLFGSKDELIGEILRRARREELAFIGDHRAEAGSGLAGVVERTWQWLADPANRSLLILWTEAYGRSLTDPSGPWARFAADTVQDWSDLLAAAQPPDHRRSAAGAAERTLALAALRGALLDMLATGDLDRTTAAIELAIRQLA
ncbi:MAG TPA: TetR/AcrR family transcriptional regulator [Streptosporangiaceae bacterium]|nr:TetR/AcrR family transcriptional regulator [Streptosporangiaceae bacterium]